MKEPFIVAEGNYINDLGGMWVRGDRIISAAIAEDPDVEGGAGAVLFHTVDGEEYTAVEHTDIALLDHLLRVFLRYLSTPHVRGTAPCPEDWRKDEVRIYSDRVEVGPADPEEEDEGEHGDDGTDAIADDDHE